MPTFTNNFLVHYVLWRYILKRFSRFILTWNTTAIYRKVSQRFTDLTFLTREKQYHCLPFAPRELHSLFARAFRFAPRYFCAAYCRKKWYSHRDEYYSLADARDRATPLLLSGFRSLRSDRPCVHMLYLHACISQYTYVLSRVYIYMYNTHRQIIIYTPDVHHVAHGMEYSDRKSRMCVSYTHTSPDHKNSKDYRYRYIVSLPVYNLWARWLRPISTVYLRHIRRTHVGRQQLESTLRIVRTWQNRCEKLDREHYSEDNFLMNEISYRICFIKLIIFAFRSLNWFIFSHLNFPGNFLLWSSLSLSLVIILMYNFYIFSHICQAILRLFYYIAYRAYFKT